MVVAEDEKKNIIGIATIELANSKETPKYFTALLLHGIYLNPSHHHQGIGRLLLK